MSSDYANHVQALRRRARRPDVKDRSGRGQEDQAAIEQSQSDDEPEYYDDEEF